MTDARESYKDPTAARSGDLKIKQVPAPPPMPTGFHQVGAVTRIPGELNDHVTIRLPISAASSAARWRCTALTRV